MLMLKEFSPATRTSTEFGWWGTEVEPVVEFVLLPRLVIVLTYTVMGAEPTLGNVTVPDVLCSLGVVGVISPIVSWVHLQTDAKRSVQIPSFHVPSGLIRVQSSPSWLFGSPLFQFV